MFHEVESRRRVQKNIDVGTTHVQDGSKVTSSFHFFSFAEDKCTGSMMRSRNINPSSSIFLRQFYSSLFLIFLTIGSLLQFNLTLTLYSCRGKSKTKPILIVNFNSYTHYRFFLRNINDSSIPFYFYRLRKNTQSRTKFIDANSKSTLL